MTVHRAKRKDGALAFFLELTVILSRWNPKQMYGYSGGNGEQQPSNLEEFDCQKGRKGYRHPKQDQVKNFDFH